jgi:hypothetical protein
MSIRASAIGILFGASVLCFPLSAGDFASYRGLQFGVNLAVAAKQAGANPGEARLVHERPALIQEMEWHPRPPAQGDSQKEDPMKDGLLYFFNGELFRIVVTYDRYKIEGMTQADMIEGISATYGAATNPKADVAYHSIYGETAAVLARWEDPEYSYNLVRTGDRSSFAMILYSKRLDALAQTAIVEAARMDKQEAPQRELDKQKKRDEEDRLVLEKARSVNKPNFRP